MSDETNELAQINASSAPDAFDMAVNQDLISFSLGSDPFDGPEVVQSMEIKSTRQVSKAVPKDSSSAKPADAGAAESRDAAADNADVKEAQTVSAGRSAFVFLGHWRQLFSQSVSTRVGRVLTNALLCVSSAKECATVFVSRRRMFWRGNTEL